MEATLIRKYLLGQVSEAERLTLEERLVSDDDTYEELLIVEDELTDEYLAEQLSKTERKDFEEHFLLPQARQEKLRFARVVRGHLATHPQSASSTEQVRKSYLSALFRFRNPVLSYSLAIAAVVLIAGISWLVWRSLTDSRGPQSTYTLTLTPGLTRDGSADNRVSIPKVDIVRVQLVLADDSSYQSYTATLESIDGRTLATERTSSRESINGRPVVTVELPSKLLPPADYRIKLSGLGADGKTVDLGSYYFKVLNP